jgi:hypothetical protein
MIDIGAKDSIAGASRGQQRDPMTGRFGLKQGMSNQMLAHMMSPKNTAQAFIHDILRRAAPQSSALLMSLLQTAQAQQQTQQQAMDQQAQQQDPFSEVPY